MRIGQVSEITSIWQKLNSSSSAAVGMSSNLLSNSVQVYMASLKTVSSSDAKLYVADKKALKEVTIRGNALNSVQSALDGMATYASIASSSSSTLAEKIDASVKFSQSLREVQRNASKANYSASASSSDKTYANLEATTTAQQAAWTSAFSALKSLSATDSTAGAKVKAALAVVEERSSANSSRKEALQSDISSLQESLSPS